MCPLHTPLHMSCAQCLIQRFHPCAMPTAFFKLYLSLSSSLFFFHLHPSTRVCISYSFFHVFGIYPLRPSFSLPPTRSLYLCMYILTRTRGHFDVAKNKVTADYICVYISFERPLPRYLNTIGRLQLVLVNAQLHPKLVFTVYILTRSDTIYYVYILRGKECLGQNEKLE